MPSLKVSEINVVPVKPQNGLLAFASFVLEEAIYCGSVGIMNRPNGGYRLLYPTKQVAGHRFDIFHPITSEAGRAIEEAVLAKYEEVMNHAGHRHSNTDLLSS